MVRVTIFPFLLLQSFVLGEYELAGHFLSIQPAPVPRRSIATAARSVFSTGTPTPASCLNKYGPICGDCNTLWSCIGKEDPVLVQNCEQTHPGKPFCERNACSANVAVDSDCSSPLQCTDTGYFPNPVNCSQYYICSAAGGESLLYECPNGFAYNPNTNRCRLATEGNCIHVDCSNNTNTYVAYPGDTSLYAYCLRNLGVLSPIMLSCPGWHFRFVDEEQRCVFQCPGEGRFEDYTDSQAYYECLWDDGKWLVSRQRCLSGFKFLEWYQKCM